jgi:DEAD/DEAH box helicase domain-containing protein
MRNPHDFIRRQPESAVVNPFNKQIMAQHLVCAAAELTLRTEEQLLNEENAPETLAKLEAQGHLLKSADGKEIYARRKAPHRDIDLRGGGNRFQIIEVRTDKPIGEIDDYRAFRETHPGAVYLHKGDTFVVDHLDIHRRGHKITEILNINKQIYVSGTKVYEGIIKVTDQVTEFEIWRSQTHTLLRRIPLDLPPQIFETQGMWFQIPKSIQRECESRPFDLMGALHAIEHAAIGIFPLLVMADRNDVGGLSTNYHPQAGSAAIFIYDGIPGGAGLTRQAFANTQQLLHYTLKAIQDCPCEEGCPSCVQSPRCGSGNRPMDKNAAIFILNRMNTPVRSKNIRGINGAASGEKERMSQPPDESRESETKAPAGSRTKFSQIMQFGVFDLETQRSAADVGGWHRADRMGISCGVIYDSQKDVFNEYSENQIPLLIADLKRFELIVGFNIKRFDFLVLKGYSDFDFTKLNTLDILEEIHCHLGFRLSLAHVTKETLGTTKTGDGLQALKWWKEGRIREIIDYCKMDVKLTRDLYLFGRQHGYLIFSNRDQKRVRIPVKW